MSYLEECINLTGAVIDGDYREFTSFSNDSEAYFTEDGIIFDNAKDGHPTFNLEMEDIVDLELLGTLLGLDTVENYIERFRNETSYFGRT